MHHQAQFMEIQKKLPSIENDITQEKNLYAISKNFNEKFAKIYSEKYNMKIIGLRFFTVYGEWGKTRYVYD